MRQSPFVVQTDQPIAVRWANGLTANQHLLPVDPTVLGPNLDAKGKPYYQVTTDPVTNVQTVTFPSRIPIVTHVHGGHTDAAYDGTPQQWFTNGGQVGPDFVGNPFVYDNSQQAATIWYHDHAIGLTRLNVYAGLAGFYIIHDTNENALIANQILPNEKYDIPLAIQDRSFYGPSSTDDPNTPWSEAPGQLYYPSEYPEPAPGTLPNPSAQPEFFGNTILVNGKAWPVLSAEPRMYRFRVLDGSNSRFYNLQFRVVEENGQLGPVVPFSQIGTDDGLLAKPVSLDHVLIAPGERADIVVDLSGLDGKTIRVTNDAPGPFPTGDAPDPETTGRIMEIKVDKSFNTSIPDAINFTPDAELNTITSLTADGPTRQLGLFEGLDSFGRLIQKLGAAVPNTNAFTPSNFVDSNGQYVNPKTVHLMPDPTSPTGMSVTEVWQVYNGTADTYPIHLHSTSFQIVSRQQFTYVVDSATGAFVVKELVPGTLTEPDANEKGWKDTAQMNPGEITTILVKFELPGNYVWHCHILEHEEHDMMHGLVIKAPTAPAAPVVMTAASTPAATGTGSPTAIATPMATASTLTDAASQPVPLTTDSTSSQVATPTVVDPSIDLTSVPLDPKLRKKLLGY